MHILFVDDEPNLLQGLQRMLRPMRREWCMEFAQSGQAALDLLAERHFDAIVSDMRMPKISGVELLLIVEREHPHMLRFILSGQMESAQVVQAVAVAHQALSKPCDAGVLTRAIRGAYSVFKSLASAALELISADPWCRAPCLQADSDELAEQLRLETPNLSALGDVVARNAALSAVLLRLTHSPLLSQSFSTWHPARAPARLDAETVRDLLDPGSKLDPHADDTLVGIACLNAAKCAQEARSIAVRRGYSEQQADEVYTAALLRDVGELVLLSKRPMECEAVARNARLRGISRIVVERETFGADHAQLGGSMLGLWGFPSIMRDIAAHHHSPEIYDGEHQKTLALICSVDAALALAQR